MSVHSLDSPESGHSGSDESSPDNCLFVPCLGLLGIVQSPQSTLLSGAVKGERCSTWSCDAPGSVCSETVSVASGLTACSGWSAMSVNKPRKWRHSGACQTNWQNPCTSQADPASNWDQTVLWFLMNHLAPTIGDPTPKNTANLPDIPLAFSFAWR